MTDQFNRIVANLKIPEEKLSEVVIIASLVEREAGKTANASKSPAL